MCEVSEKWYREGIAAGEARGVAIGEARGVAIGEARGKAIGEAIGEMKKAKETAFELYNRKMSIETIAAVLKVNLETVRGWFSEKPSVSR